MNHNVNPKCLSLVLSLCMLVEVFSLSNGYVNATTIVDLYAIFPINISFSPVNFNIIPTSIWKINLLLNVRMVKLLLEGSKT